MLKIEFWQRVVNADTRKKIKFAKRSEPTDIKHVGLKKHIHILRILY
jgi:hypothetical protein